MPEPIAVAFAHLLGNYEFHTSNYALLVYDYMLTFGEEVEKMWSRPFTLPTLLFYINRYVTHFQFIIIQVAFHETTWSVSMCNRYVKFAGASTTSLVAVAELIMILRVYALYLGNKKILVFLLFLLSGQVIASGWAVHNGMRVPQPPQFPGCVLTGKNTSFAALWGAPLVTDSCIFLLTIWKTIRYMRRHGRMTALDILLRDGTLYFLTIFGVNLMNFLIYFTAVGDLRAVGASFSQILTSIMISRLQLNLRYTKSDTRNPLFESQKTSGASSSAMFTSVVNTDTMKSQWDSERSFFTVGNLGGELRPSYDTIPGSGSSGSETAVYDDRIELSERSHWGW
jgi:hypothetical protein